MMKIRRSSLTVPCRRLAAATLSALLLGVVCNATAQTLIPSLERQDHVGDLGRAAREKAVARFDGADADKDGRLSKAEVEGRLTYVAENFDRLDTNHDGYLSWQEFIGHDRWKKE
ncbi:MAG TPA: hypothetical protein VJ673_07045 [Aromatoleum sp.]|uniref:hypothetical protein n=1 Tax=Aromatoleum sp. TaxID=2307007 RepID=UPI002B49701B|nr:hypothetical protein [Aromatoleum sp.]HJV25424.1 hypothetical protein [Aromatoleum sp.]